MKKIILFTLICLTGLWGLSYAQTARGKSIMLPGGKWWRMPQIKAELGLTAQEESQLDNLFKKNRRNLIDLKGNVAKIQFDLEEVFESKAFNEKIAKDHFKKLQDARFNLSMERFDYLIKIRKLLGYDRYQTLKIKYMEQRMKRKNTQRPKQMKNTKKKPKGDTPFE